MCTLYNERPQPMPLGRPEVANINAVLPEVASATVEIPLRSEVGRDEPGMLTGSERTGWIL